MLVHSYSVCLYFAIVVGCFFLFVFVFFEGKKGFQIIEKLISSYLKCIYKSNSIFLSHE